MACNVFGVPITTSILMEMPEFRGEPASAITVSDRARVALSMKNEDHKDVHARRYVQSLRSKSGPGGVSTLGLVYNATGDPVTVVTSYDFCGHLATEDPYPTVIANGQWGGFLHGKTDENTAGSSAAVVFRGKNQAEDDYDWIFAWYNPWSTLFYSNKAYTGILEADPHSENQNEEFWTIIQHRMTGSGTCSSAASDGCFSVVSIGNATSPIFEAIMTLKKEKELKKDA